LFLNQNDKTGKHELAIFFFFAVLEFELRVLNLLGRCCTLEPCPPPYKTLSQNLLLDFGIEKMITGSCTQPLVLNCPEVNGITYHCSEDEHDHILKLGISKINPGTGHSGSWL
jgi:hypothetical protein